MLAEYVVHSETKDSKSLVVAESGGGTYDWVAFDEDLSFSLIACMKATSPFRRDTVVSAKFVKACWSLRDGQRRDLTCTQIII
jgi:hypothetical protein